jgi:O-antigen ligase
MPVDRGTVLIFEYFTAFAVLLMLSSNGFWILFGYEEDTPNDSRISALLLMCAIFAIAGVCILRHWRTFASAIPKAWPLLALSVLAVASSLWSDVPGVTFRRGLVLLATTLFGVYLGARFRPDRQLFLLAACLGLIAIASLCAALWFPSYGISSEAGHVGDWKGIFVQKNVLGSLMSLSCLVFIMLPRDHRVLRLCGLLLSVALLLASGSRTAMVISGLLLACYVMCRLGRLRLTLPALVSIAGVAACLCAIPLIGFDSAGMLKLLGRDATLTGRTDLWVIVLTVILRRPWLGYGFNALWYSDTTTEWRIQQQAGWAAHEAHSGLLDLALALGATGVAVFVCGFVVYLARAAAAVRRSSGDDVLWPFLYLVFLLVYNVAESLGATSSIYWCVYVSVAVSVSRHGLNTGGRVVGDGVDNAADPRRLA